MKVMELVVYLYLFVLLVIFIHIRIYVCRKNISVICYYVEISLTVCDMRVDILLVGAA